jgi:hypothetical protein
LRSGSVHGHETGRRLCPQFLGRAAGQLFKHDAAGSTPDILAISCQPLHRSEQTTADRRRWYGAPVDMCALSGWCTRRSVVAGVYQGASRSLIEEALDGTASLKYNAAVRCPATRVSLVIDAPRPCAQSRVGPEQHSSHDRSSVHLAVRGLRVVPHAPGRSSTQRSTASTG